MDINDLCCCILNIQPQNYSFTRLFGVKLMEISDWLKCAINLRGFQRFDRGTLYKLLGQPKLITLAEALYNFDT